VDNNLITLRGLVASLDGKTIYKLIKTGPIDDAINIGHALGVQLLGMGADKVLKSLSL
jgi:porphobilinogen deaminase